MNILRHRTIFLVLLAVVSIAAVQLTVHSQAPIDEKRSFEVATVRLHPLDSPGGLPRVGASCHGIDSHYPPNGPSPPPLGRCLFIRMPLGILIRYAFAQSVPGPEIPVKLTGGPSWINTDLWDVEAKSEETANSSEAELQEMLRSLLADRFKLLAHRESGASPGFALVVGKTGVKMKRDETCEELPTPKFNGNVLSFEKMPMKFFARFLSSPAGVVADKTGLDGCYSFAYEMPPPLKANLTGDEEDSGPSVFSAVQTLGLRLEAGKIPTEIIIIDHAEKPAAN